MGKIKSKWTVKWLRDRRQQNRLSCLLFFGQWAKIGLMGAFGGDLWMTFSKPLVNSPPPLQHLFSSTIKASMPTNQVSLIKTQNSLM